MAPHDAPQAAPDLTVARHFDVGPQCMDFVSDHAHLAAAYAEIAGVNARIYDDVETVVALKRLRTVALGMADMIAPLEDRIRRRRAAEAAERLDEEDDGPTFGPR